MAGKMILERTSIFLALWEKQTKMISLRLDDEGRKKFIAC